jgi:hypothetical protein
MEKTKVFHFVSARRNNRGHRSRFAFRKIAMDSIHYLFKIKIVIYQISITNGPNFNRHIKPDIRTVTFFVPVGSVPVFGFQYRIKYKQVNVCKYTPTIHPSLLAKKYSDQNIKQKIADINNRNNKQMYEVLN